MNTISMKEMLRAELDREAIATRKALERVPAGKGDWKPHEKSSPLGKLAAHVATLPHGIAMVVKDDVMEAGGHRPAEPLATAAELVAAFDKYLTEAKTALEAVSEEDLAKQWTLTFQEKKIMEMPKYNAVQMIFINHLIHHRAQLGVYLRLNGVPVPASYGPSADEPQ